MSVGEQRSNVKVRAAYADTSPYDRPSSTGAFVCLDDEHSVRSQPGYHQPHHIPLDHVIISPELRRQLGIMLLTRIKLRPENRELAPAPLPTQALVLHPLQWIDKGSTQLKDMPGSEELKREQLLEGFRCMREQMTPGAMIPAVQGSIVKILLESGPMHFLLKFESGQT